MIIWSYNIISFTNRLPTKCSLMEVKEKILFFFLFSLYIDKEKKIVDYPCMYSSCICKTAIRISFFLYINCVARWWTWLLTDMMEPGVRNGPRWTGRVCWTASKISFVLSISLSLSFPSVCVCVYLSLYTHTIQFPIGQPSVPVYLYSWWSLF